MWSVKKYTSVKINKKLIKNKLHTKIKVNNIGFFISMF